MKIINNIEDLKLNDIVEDKYGMRYVIGIRNNIFVAVHPPTCGSEREGECRFDYLSDLTELEKIGNYDENPELVDNDNNNDDYLESYPFLN